MIRTYLDELGVPYEMFVQTRMLVPMSELRDELLFSKIGVFLSAAGIHAGVTSHILQLLKDEPVDDIAVADGRYVVVGAAQIFDAVTGNVVTTFPDPELLVVLRVRRVIARIATILHDQTTEVPPS